MDYDARLLIGRSVTLTIAKTARRTVFRECVVKKFMAEHGVWICRDVHTRNQYIFDLADIIHGQVNILLE
jgi:hypothetical protein